MTSLLPSHHHRSASWTTALHVPLPCGRNRLRIPLPNLRVLHAASVSRYGKGKGNALIFSVYAAIFLIIYALLPSFSITPTLVFRREDLRRIWKWEIESGHYPTRHRIPEELGLVPVDNPALPLQRFGHDPGHGVGRKRFYLNVEATPPHVAYAPRPIPGSIADLDVIMEHCDVSGNRYVRDCLEVLRVGAGLDNDERVRQPVPDGWKYVFVEDTVTQPIPTRTLHSFFASKNKRKALLDAKFIKKPNVEWEPSPISLPPTQEYHVYSSAHGPCDPNDPRIFHMYWTGKFTDKPYFAIISFLFTQNIGLHAPDYEDERVFCRPQLWLWINPVPAAAEPPPDAHSDLIKELRENPWSAPFFHPRFSRVIQFRFWNTTEQLDSLPELKDDWRHVGSVFKSHGKSYSRGSKAALRSGSKSSSSYDRLSVIMSDMVRFVLCQRFGGIYLDADTLFLRDWEELWGWKGSFSYRWAFHQRYNTAVLRLNKGSALGTFLLRTALKNELDFHPVPASNYLKHGRLDPLLYRAPGALFDPAWMNTDGYQRDRPPQPYFKRFSDFFETPSSVGGSPQALGFDGFFKGAFSYHFHNSWWKPVDPGQNWPNLGQEFGNNATNDAVFPDDERDWSWSTVLKRTFEAYIRGERPNMYGEWILW
ncbi:uncharacterized protein BT62DRAFT_944268 [Guyanagaster necrorhizus]|uniref:Glycosyltransferase family 32 protein n=1 Tax=Guyanagaster necrorhizus TaxID=856835 RepID=A0A9P7W0I9_9AGAR|nr:uncharacterized protein BT62DRAFT_944268 [Guyanagaster necrorhizus MCA 3950]KAG7449744.1 hypothetical protein BT62DRAFT_944268 [Guyanagaster necrorhizus MCA 3950]